MCRRIPAESCSAVERGRRMGSVDGRHQREGTCQTHRPNSAWRPLPKRSRTSIETKAGEDVRSPEGNEQCTLQVCASANRNCNVELLLAYHSENHSALKGNTALKNKFPVFWRAKRNPSHCFSSSDSPKFFAPTAGNTSRKMNFPRSVCVDADLARLRVMQQTSSCTAFISPRIVNRQLICSFGKFYIKPFFGGVSR